VAEDPSIYIYMCCFVLLVNLALDFSSEGGWEGLKGSQIELNGRQIDPKVFCPKTKVFWDRKLARGVGRRNDRFGVGWLIDGLVV